MKPAERYVFCQYCDDIRQEVDGKVTMVGVYQGGMQINMPLPTVIPVLNISCNVWTPKVRPLQKMALRVMMGNDQVLATEIPDEAVQNTHNDVNANNDDSGGTLVNIRLRLEQIPVTAPGKLVMWVTTEEGELRGTSLDIRTLPAELSAAPPIFESH